MDDCSFIALDENSCDKYFVAGTAEANNAIPPMAIAAMLAMARGMYFWVLELPASGLSIFSSTKKQNA